MNSVNRRDNSRHVKAPTGPELTCKHWGAEAPMRMLMNNLDDEVAENPQELVVYGGIGRAARNWECFDNIVKALKSLGEDETLLVQSGKGLGLTLGFTVVHRHSLTIYSPSSIRTDASGNSFFKSDLSACIIEEELVTGRCMPNGARNLEPHTKPSAAAVQAPLSAAAPHLSLFLLCRRLRA